MVATSRVAAGSHVTLHYRIAVQLDGNEHEVVSTFDARPATVQVGAGQFSEALEQRLIGLEEGAGGDRSTWQPAKPSATATPSWCRR